MDKQMAKRLLPLVNNKDQWEPLQEFLQQQTQMTHQALVMAQSEQEMRQLQGKATLLATLLQLKEWVRAEAERKDG
jgi:uncharacterized protein YbgA (DUF1722 family)